MLASCGRSHTPEMILLLRWDVVNAIGNARFSDQLNSGGGVEDPPEECRDTGSPGCALGPAPTSRSRTLILPEVVSIKLPPQQGRRLNGPDISHLVLLIPRGFASAMIRD